MPIPYKDLIASFAVGDRSEILTEELHSELQDVLDSPDVPQHKKLTEMSKRIRNLTSRGEDTGLEDDKPKKGSSRAVFFPHEPHPVTLDGIQTKVPTAVKIAFPSQLENHKTGVNPVNDELLGHMQNRMESDHLLTQSYSVMHKNRHGNGYFTNPEGILPPHFDNHDDHHWLRVGRVEKMNAKDFKESTKHPDFPKGITHTEFHDTIQNMWSKAHGMEGYHYASTPRERMEKLEDHPLCNSAFNMCSDFSIHPGDFAPRNMGIWHHPIHGTKHPVILDYGFSKDIGKRYQDLRMKLSNYNQRLRRGY